MTERVQLDPEAERELLEAIAWYEGELGGLGLELLDELVSTATLVGETPGIGRVIGAASDGRPIRQFRISRFPYAIVYVELVDHVRVIAVAHGKRFSEYWKQRVR